MKKLFIVALFLASMVFVHAEDWTTDYKAALVQAKAQNKLVLLDFTGSDWCGYCKLLEKEVLTHQSFKDFADAHFILVTVDFPRRTALPEDLQQQNLALKNKFNVNGFPTLIVVNAKGKDRGRQVGYQPGSGANAVIARLKSIIGN
jgi:thioredoxin-related protein